MILQCFWGVVLFGSEQSRWLYLSHIDFPFQGSESSSSVSEGLWWSVSGWLCTINPPAVRECCVAVQTLYMLSSCIVLLSWQKGVLFVCHPFLVIYTLIKITPPPTNRQSLCESLRPAIKKRKESHDAWKILASWLQNLARNDSSIRFQFQNIY